MSREIRHLIGVVTGLAALPLVYYLTEAGARGLRAAHAAFSPGPQGLGHLMVVAAIVSVLAAWPWLSPLAALTCGLPLAVAGGLFALDLDAATGLAGALPRLTASTGEPPGTLAGATGLYAVIGVSLVLSALAPHRLRAIRKK
ncbi:hypothetical protein [Nonomuraea cavernae]|uniref:Uncharacterized protein n=1 Tax=Nonomuraea cavernae TaxID=2045107 RepID=A0A917YTE6_9ACTN|nr:hypothetical protein [Nonomuraea cavernae]MCA2184450.1 hypothetical protein [Nonomuraea cavernae]GGO63762.1 hypothetical protein GCM10012289_11580 [Nonomuraea cavernae]